MRVTSGFIIIVFLGVILALSGCCGKRSIQYDYVTPPVKISKYFDVYQKAGSKWIYKNKNGLIHDTIELLQMVDSLELSIAKGGVPCPPDAWMYRQEKGFVLKSRTFGILHASFRNDELYFNDNRHMLYWSLYLDNDSLKYGYIDDLAEIRLNDSTYYGNRVLGLKNYRNNDLKAFVASGQGIVGWYDDNTLDTFNLMKYEE